MFVEFENEMKQKNLNSIGVNMALNSMGDFILFPKGKGEDIKRYYKGNIDDDTIINKILEFMKFSLDKQEYKQQDNIYDEFHEFEENEYKKDKCKSMKLITINISRVYPGKIILVDMVNVAKYEWGGGKYMHFLPINSSYDAVLQLLRKLYKYEGHMAGATAEEKKKYRVLTNNKKD